MDRNQTICVEVKALAVLNVPSTETEGCVAVSGVAQGRLSNSKILADLDSHLSYLTLEPPEVAVYLKAPAGKFYPHTWQLFLYG